MSHYIRTVIEHNKLYGSGGLYSICSANYYVLKTAMLRAEKEDIPLLIEATSNQVDQYGGYTGMTPLDFKQYVYNIAAEVNFPSKQIILGGDHLGPNRWQDKSADSAMQKAVVQIKAYVRAGFQKIHLDTSMPLGGDKKKNGLPLEIGLVADRAAELCAAAEEEAKVFAKKPVYVIGTDVPIPGGALETEDDIRVTRAREVEETINTTRRAFVNKVSENAWQRVVAVVAQPGVEFSDAQVFEYNPSKAKNLKRIIKKYSGIAYEAHSTDYQKKEDLRSMVNDHFTILKVGPWLTFAFREAVFALAFIEKEMLASRKGINLSNIEDVIERTMLQRPEYWQNHYHGGENELRLARRYSLSDRIRYYWPLPEIQQALNRLINNLTRHIPALSLLSQYLPLEYEAIREKKIGQNPLDIIFHKIDQVLDKYSYACQSS